MVLRIHGKDESVVRFRQGAPYKIFRTDVNKYVGLFLFYVKYIRGLIIYGRYHHR